MNIQQFQYVLAVVDSVNFEEAAERCFITQSTLSTMIGRFEDEIGIRVFNRKTKPVSITAEGKQIIDRLRIITSEIDALKNIVQEIKGEMVGELKIGIIPTIAPYLLPLFLAKFAAKFPKVKIIVKEMPTPEIRKALKNRALDIGLLAMPIIDEELVGQELYIEPFMVYDCSNARKTAKVSIENLDYSKLWLLEEGHCLRTQVYHICELSNQSDKCDINFEFESGSMDSLLRFTKANSGLTIIPYLASLDLKEVSNCQVIKFNNPVPVRSVGILKHKYFVKNMLVEELAKVIQAEVLPLLPEIEITEVINPV